MRFLGMNHMKTGVNLYLELPLDTLYSPYDSSPTNHVPDNGAKLRQPISFIPINTLRDRFLISLEKEIVVSELP